MKSRKRKFRRSLRAEVITIALVLAAITVPLFYAGSVFFRLSQ